MELENNLTGYYYYYYYYRHHHCHHHYYNDKNNNNNNSYRALCPVNIYRLAALYIINIKIRLTVKTNKQVL